MDNYNIVKKYSCPNLRCNLKLTRNKFNTCMYVQNATGQGIY